MRHGVAGRVGGQPEEERPAAVSRKRPDEGAGSDVQGDDHGSRRQSFTP